jgi:hypothetical protein
MHTSCYLERLTLFLMKSSYLSKKNFFTLIETVHFTCLDQSCWFRTRYMGTKKKKLVQYPSFFCLMVR